ncbi:hypothetical protein CsSME_00041588 [Camellia sinensis var. sinensis]
MHVHIYLAVTRFVSSGEAASMQLSGSAFGLGEYASSVLVMEGWLNVGGFNLQLYTIILVV